MLINTLVALLSLALASYEDMRIREIPDLLSFSMIGIGSFLAIVNSISMNSFQPIINAFFGVLAGIIIGFLLYFSGQWGGGDTKVLMGMGALMGLNINLLFNTIPPLIMFFINIFLVGALLGLIYVIYLAILNKNKFKKSFKDIRTTKANKMIRKTYLILIPILLIILFLLPINILLRLVFILFVVLIYFLYQLSMIIKAVEKSCMIKKIPLSKLTEGDWITGKIKLKNNKIFASEKTGISAKDIALLKKNKIKFVNVKYGMPFLPSFFVAYILTIILGNWFLLF